MSIIGWPRLEAGQQGLAVCEKDGPWGGALAEFMGLENNGLRSGIGWQGDPSLGILYEAEIARFG